MTTETFLATCIEHVTMAGRPKLGQQEFRASITIKNESGTKTILEDIVLCCPACFGTDIREDGSRMREDGRVKAYACKSDSCRIKRGRKSARQFTVSSSGTIKRMVESEVKDMIDDLYRRGAKAKTVAGTHGMSEAMVSLFRSQVDKAIERGLQRDALVNQPTSDDAISVDETFFTIDGQTVYVIIARGYKSSKVLGINVSRSRGEADMRVAFDEAQANSTVQFGTITADAHGATRSMARNLGYPLTLIIHPHRRPYNKAIIERIEYEGDAQIITRIGVATDIFKKKGKRQFHYQQEKKELKAAPKRPRGRPKGSKTRPRSVRDKEKAKKNQAGKASLQYSRMEKRDMFMSTPIGNN